jgi:hypothetical protein
MRHLPHRSYSMTIYDLGSIVLFFGAIGMLAVATTLSLSGRKRASRLIWRGMAGAAVTYVVASVTLAAFAKQAPLGVGDPQCVDNWCIALENVKSTALDQNREYDVTLVLFSRANRAVTSFGAHATANPATDVYLVDGDGIRYDARPHPSEISLNVPLAPGEAVRTRRVFELPAKARNIGLLADRGSFGMCPMIGECSTSHSAADYVVASGVYRKGSSFLALVNGLKRNAATKPPEWR